MELHTCLNGYGTSHIPLPQVKEVGLMHSEGVLASHSTFVSERLWNLHMEPSTAHCRRSRRWR